MDPLLTNVPLRCEQTFESLCIPNVLFISTLSCAKYTKCETEIEQEPLISFAGGRGKRAPESLDLVLLKTVMTCMLWPYKSLMTSETEVLCA